jgi:ParB family chromosome partitioning protein
MSKFQNDAIFWVDVEKIDPNPYQPRRDFNEDGLRDLAESIRQYGVLQPLTVTRNEETKDDGGLKVYYELIAGERRLRAAKMANLSQVPVTIRDEKEDAEVKLELAIIENLQREDLNPIERAEAFNQLSEEFDFTHKEIAGKIGKSREYVSNSMRLLKLPEKIKQAVIAGKITEGHARPIMMLRDKPDKQQQLFKEVVRKDLTVRETEERARRDAQDKVRKKKNKIDPETKALEEELSDTLGTRVTIEKDKEGGKLVIDFFSDEDLESLIEMVKNNEEASMDEVMKEYANALDDDSGEGEESQPDEGTVTPAETKTNEEVSEERKEPTEDVPAGSEDESISKEQTVSSTANDEQSQSMAETLGTMIQQARAEKEQKNSEDNQSANSSAEIDGTHKGSSQDQEVSETDEGDVGSEVSAETTDVPESMQPTNQEVEREAGTTETQEAEHDSANENSNSNSGISIMDQFDNEEFQKDADSSDEAEVVHAENTDNQTVADTEGVRLDDESDQQPETAESHEPKDDPAAENDTEINSSEDESHRQEQATSTKDKTDSDVGSDHDKTEQANEDDVKRSQKEEKVTAGAQNTDADDDEDDMYSVSNFSI